MFEDIFASSLVKRFERDEDRVFNEDVLAYELVTACKESTSACNTSISFATDELNELNDAVLK